MTPNLTTYTTPELERLTTLTEKTAKPGEFVRRITTTTFRMRDSHVTDENGYTRLASDADYRGPERRVTSFTDATELDPPQAEMLAELARRKAPAFKVGELVMLDGETRLVSRVPERYGSMSWARHADTVWLDNGNEPPTWVDRAKLRPATDAEVAAYHRLHCVKPCVAPPEINRVYVRKDGAGLGYRYRWNGEQWERQCMTEPWLDWKGRWVTDIFNDRCQKRWEEGGFVPEPVVITNATHAGRRVKVNGVSGYVVVDQTTTDAARYGMLGLGGWIALCYVERGSVAFYRPVEVALD